MSNVPTGQKVIVPAVPERVDDVTKKICDFCGDYLPPANGEVDEITILLTFGYRDPYDNDTYTNEADVCRGCVDSKLKPLLIPASASVLDCRS